MERSPLIETDGMARAIAQAESATRRGEVPVGAAIVHAPTGDVVASAGNRCEALRDPTAHAELLALRQATNYLARSHLEDCDLYVTLEPCAMCASAIALVRLRRVYFGAYDPKSGGVVHGARIFETPSCHHEPEVVGGIEEARCQALLKDFFSDLRAGKILSLPDLPPVVAVKERAKG